jgi:signal transduction histidine kinase
MQVACCCRRAADHATDRVDVTVAVTEEAAIVIVVDDGPGIPESDRDRIFDRFRRLDTSRNRTRGGGADLGLRSPRRSSKPTTANIAIDSSDVNGARFVVTLPKLSW